MKLHELRLPNGSRKKRKRIGRGKGTGSGETAGKGTKGQNARSGGGVHLGFEGGQMPLQRRIPKRGFTNIFKKQYEIINIKDLQQFKPGEVINRDTLIAKGLVKKSWEIKLLGKGELSTPLKIKVNKASQAAKKKIESVGGEIEID
ncbi:MAG: 50S ribosomal protein L15 [Thermodesulfobacteriota bacterium]|jgi:large subunit ribosomal protein L15